MANHIGIQPQPSGHASKRRCFGEARKHVGVQAVAPREAAAEEEMGKGSSGLPSHALPLGFLLHNV